MIYQPPSPGNLSEDDNNIASGMVHYNHMQGGRSAAALHHPDQDGNDGVNAAVAA